MKVGILGLGLIGGSLARAYAKAGNTVYAYDKDENILAFAELANNVVALEKLETEKAELYEKVRFTLRNAGLTLEDLSPKYACEKCNDTGYVGTHRCDCYDKKI